jgi:hypothetical protein
MLGYVHSLRFCCVFGLLWCWQGHVRGTSPEHSHIPWDDLHAEPGKFYDTSLFSLPAALQNPNSMSNVDTIAISEFLLRHSSVLADKPFHFFSEEQISARRAVSNNQQLVVSGDMPAIHTEIEWVKYLNIDRFMI